jgi:hypothetical protein
MVIWCGDNTLSNGNHWWELGFHGSVTTYQEVVKMFLTLGFIQNNFFLLCIERCSVYSLIDVNNNPRMRLIYSKVILIAWKKVGLFLFFLFLVFVSVFTGFIWCCFDYVVFYRFSMIWTSWSRCQTTPNEDDTSPRKLKIRFEKYDTMETCLKAPTLLELKWMPPQSQLYLDKSDLIFFPAKITCCIMQNTSLFHKFMVTCFSAYKKLI